MSHKSYEPRCSGTKVCCKCNKELPVIFFSVEHKSLDGLESHCRDCQSKYNKKNLALIKRKAKRIEKERSLYYFRSE
jgi:hypothetical protein